MARARKFSPSFPLFAPTIPRIQLPIHLQNKSRKCSESDESGQSSSPAIVPPNPRANALALKTSPHLPPLHPPVPRLQLVHHAHPLAGHCSTFFLIACPAQISPSTAFTPPAQIPPGPFSFCRTFIAIITALCGIIRCRRRVRCSVRR